jgi:hypothetical protein
MLKDMMLRSVMDKIEDKMNESTLFMVQHYSGRWYANLIYVDGAYIDKHASGDTSAEAILNLLDVIE